MFKSIRQLLGIVTIAALVLTACAPKATATPAPAGGLSATVSDIVNTVLGRPAAQGDFAQVASGFVLEIGGGVKTEDSASAKLQFSDGSIVRVASNSSFVLKNTTTTGGALTTLQLELGKIFVYVSGGTMEIDTPVGVASVKGSWASFAFDPGDPNDPNDDKLIIECVEGDCEAHNAAGQISLGNFQGAVLTNGGAGGTTELTGAALQAFFDQNKDVATALAGTLTAVAPNGTATPTATKAASATLQATATEGATATSTATPQRLATATTSAGCPVGQFLDPLTNLCRALNTATPTPATGGPIHLAISNVKAAYSQYVCGQYDFKADVVDTVGVASVVVVFDDGAEIGLSQGGGNTWSGSGFPPYGTHSWHIHATSDDGSTNNAPGGSITENGC